MTKKPTNDNKRAKETTATSTNKVADVQQDLQKQEHENKTVKKHAADEITKIKEDYEQQIAALKDQMLRVAASAENIKKASQKDVEEARKYATSSIAKDLLDVLDNLFRASQSVSDEKAAENPDIKALKDGVEMTKKAMISAFEKHGIKRIYPLGEQFNHDFHEAISQVEDKNAKSGVVIDVMQAGYVLNGRLLKAALVVVAK